MNIKLPLIATALLIAFSTSAFSQGFPESWENNLNGWGNFSDPQSFSMTTGVTLGLYSLQINIDGEQSGLLTESFAQDWRTEILAVSDPVIEFDIVVSGGDATFASFDVSSFGGPGNVFFYHSTGTGSSAPTSYNLGAGGIQTISITVVPDAITAMTPLTDFMGMQLWMFTDATSGSTGMQVNIDNFRLSSIPEPSTYAAMAGVLVFAIAAIRRRKA